MSSVSSSGVIPLTRPVAPRRFGQYLLYRKLAEGGMAEIYLAKQIGAEGFERDVVIKCMLDHLSQNRDFVAMFLDEARLAARLHHPNIVQITDLGVADGRYFICMEYLAGEDLDALIACATQRNQAIPIPVAARIMLSAIEGLEFAHGYQEQGKPLELVHRDVSPSNILVTYQGTVKVLDFGIAKASSRMTQTQPGLLKGKWGYMSPEQARGEPIDARSDLFSLGVTFHELLTGRRVFERDHEIGVLLALMAQPIPPPSTVRPDIPPALERIIMKALERQREDRYPSASAMRAELEDFLRSTPSVPGVSQLAQYMQRLFGPDEVALKTKIPSLSEIPVYTPPAPEPSESLGFEKTLVRPTDPEVRAAAAPAASATELPPRSAPSPAPAPARSAGKAMAMGALGALVVLVLGGGAAWYFLLRPQPSAPVAVVAPPAPSPVSPVEPAAPVAPVAPVAPALPEAQQPAPTPVTPPEPPPSEPVAKPRPPASSPVVLNEKLVRGVLNKHGAKVLGCAEQFRAELPADSRVTLLLKIKNSGEVRDARITTPSALAPNLSKCLVNSARRLRFPLNKNNPEFAVELPMKFTGN